MRRQGRYVAFVKAALAALGLAAMTVLAASPAELYRQVGFEQRLGAPLPHETRFIDDTGAPVALGDVLRGRAAVLIFAVWSCPHLCPTVLDSLFGSLARVGLVAGKDFELVAVGIDPREPPAKAAAKKASLMDRHPRVGTAHFLTGSADQIGRLAAVTGFRYFYDAERDEFVHPAGIIIVNADGRISRYFFGADAPAFELRLALVEASNNRIGTLTDRFWLLCHRYDPTQSRYGVWIVNGLRVAGVAAALGLAGFVVVMLRRERVTGGRRSG